MKLEKKIKDDTKPRAVRIGGDWEKAQKLLKSKYNMTITDFIREQITDLLDSQKKEVK